MRIIKRLIFTLILVIFASVVIGCTNENVDKGEGYTFVGLSINPEVGLIADEEGEVVDVITLNEDADVLLSNIDVVGEEVDAAIETIVDESVASGYIDVDTEGKEVFVDIETEDEEIKKNLFERITKKINNYFKNKGIFGKVSEGTLEKYLEDATNIGESVGKTKMILLALELNPELTIEDVKDLSMSQLIKLIHLNNKKDNLGHTLNKELKLEIEILKNEFSELFELKLENEEIKIQLENSELTEEDRLALTTKLEENKLRINELEAEYKVKFINIRESFKQKVAEYKEEWKEFKNKKENSVKDKVKEHLDKIKQRPEIKTQVEKFQR